MDEFPFQLVDKGDVGSDAPHDDQLVLHFQQLPTELVLAVDVSPGCGGRAWPAGEVLATYLSTVYAHKLPGKNVLELGSGTGLVGLVAGMLGAHTWITDQAPLLDLMAKNIALNNLEKSVHVAELNWGVPLPTSFPSPDIVLAADCVYLESAFPLLVQTLSDLSERPVDILFCYKKRRKADKRFFTLLKKKFDWTEIMDHPDRETYTREAISLMRLERRK